MCLALSALQRLTPSSERYGALLASGRAHLEFACELAEAQIARGGRVFLEHPWSATSWMEPRLRALLAKEGVRRARCDQCLFGMRTVDAYGTVMPAQKATGFLTNDEFLARALERRCPGHHDHCALMGGRAKVAEKCPPRLVTAVLKALRASMVAAGCGPADGLEDGSRALSSVETGTVLEEPEPWAREAATDEEQIVRDQAAGLPLDPKLVQAAREEEWAYMAELEVMKPSSMDERLAETGRRPVPCRWVDVDKGDAWNPKVRSRLVCQETKRRSTIEADDWTAVFAATPPYEAFRMQVSLALTGERPSDASQEQVSSFYDISRLTCTALC